ncbi:MAG: hypothetical protein JXC32_07530, partial [Anaerolineae bacterium]|nr:hypothetical protein [Anaerolineae bacterium]
MKERRKTFVAILVLGLLLTPVAGIGQAQEARPAMPDTQAERTQSATDLLIITPRAFETVLAPLVDHKTATGISTAMITLEDVYRTGSGDEAEQVKQAIRDYYDSSSVKYVMLVGDVDRFPVRWVTAVRGTETEYFFPSDLYYADLYNADETPATWDYDADDLYGEHRCAPDASDANLDRLDLHPEVAVGRVPASTVEEVESYVAKIIRYEHLTYDADWFRNVLLIAGGGRTKSRWCDPGINFAEVQGHLGSAFGDTFTYRTWMYEKYYLDTGEETGRPCVCEAFEPLFMCLTRTRLPDTASVAVFENAGRWGPNLPNLAAPIAEFEDVGFLGWHDHTSSIRDYTRDVDNTDRFSVAFADGCGDGAFAGPDIGSVSRFAEPYLTADGHALQVLFSDVVLDTDGDGVNETYYHATGCALDGSPPVALDGAHCSGGIYPGMVIADDFGLDPSAAAPVPRTSPYVLNSPSPAPLQLCDWEWNPESKLFAKREATGKETGWIGMVGATKGVQFPHNGELLELFFEGYAVPHGSVAGRRRMGDAWRSMMERWLDIVFDASGDFGMDHIYDVYHIAPSEIPCAGYAGMQHAMMYALFGDPSLRIGGIDLPADILPPTTTDDTDGAWHSEPVEVTLTAADAGSPPSGVRTTTYSVLGGGGERVGTHFTISAPSDHSNDGIHEIKYFSVDFLENAETMNLAEVKIDTVAPDTKAYLDGAPVHASAGSDTALPVIGFPMEITEAGQQGMLFYPSESIPTDRGCYNVSVDVTLAAVDDVSDVASTWFWVDRSTRLPELYHGSFSIHAGDYVTPVVLEFWSEDNAGNVERAHVTRVCVTDYRAGLIKDSVRVLAALEEIIAMQMRQDLASTLPPIKAVGFDYQFKGEPGSPWTAIGLDENGKDGWRVDWKTTEVENGDYGLRMTAWGFPQTQAGEPQAEDPLVYQEEVGVTVS